MVRLIDGPQAAAATAAAGTAAAAASLLGRSCGLDVVQWVPQLSVPARKALLQAEQLRRATGMGMDVSSACMVNGCKFSMHL